MADELGLARRMWWLLEPVHALLYYAPEAFEQAEELGYRIDERWPSYFAWRSAPLGAAGAELVAAAFYSFDPQLVREHVPAAWEIASPEQVLTARTSAMDQTFRRLLDGVPVAEAAKLARRAAEAVDTAGRPLAAANAGLPWPDEPHLVLWQAATILREHRGDGHVSALLNAGLDPVEALVSFASVGAAPAEVFASRGWSDEQWSAARERLLSRDLVDAEGTATGSGRRLRAEVERRTDELAAGPWRELGEASAGALAELVEPVFGRAIGSGVLPARSTLGVGMQFA
ncbi:hypothetical protein AB0L13_17035 [Saccharopolyspora shandongensis]|uniref:SCO6745 family protein n=1 Tax=Saccharopolyspora shandongensis TaxID=418495 RepID=UPI0034208BB7